MLRIAVTGLLPRETHDPSHCDDFLGLTLEADGPMVEAIFSAHPDLPRLLNHYAVAQTEALRVLDQAGREQAVIYWGYVVREHILWVPHTAAIRLDSPKE